MPHEFKEIITWLSGLSTLAMLWIIVTTGWKRQWLFAWSHDESMRMMQERVDAEKDEKAAWRDAFYRSEAARERAIATAKTLAEKA